MVRPSLCLDRTPMMVLALALSLASPVHADQRGAAAEVYARLIAPCCWNQTLDIHDSELATRLRLEVADRLAHGEPAVAIEDDLAARFGAQIRAVPRGHDPRQAVALWVFAALALTLCGLFALASRWTRRSARSTALDDEQDALAEALHPDYDARLERELERIDASSH